MKGALFDLFAFALNLYRAPLRYLSYVALDRSVPAEFGALLETLNRRSDQPVWAEIGEQLQATPQELREAGLFLVKRLAFAEGADHYRALGLDPRVSVDQVRERYRQLIALFHPDRNPDGDEWSELYAPKINEAYNVLKNPAKKQEYDESLRDHSPFGPMGGMPARRPFEMPTFGDGDSGFDITGSDGGTAYRYPLWRRRPALVIWSVVGGLGLVLLGALGVRLVGQGQEEVLTASRSVMGAAPVAGNTTWQTESEQAFRTALERSSESLIQGGERYAHVPREGDRQRQVGIEDSYRFAENLVRDRPDPAAVEAVRILGPAVAAPMVDATALPVAQAEESAGIQSKGRQQPDLAMTSDGRERPELAPDSVPAQGVTDIPARIVVASADQRSAASTAETRAGIGAVVDMRAARSEPAPASRSESRTPEPGAKPADRKIAQPDVAVLPTAVFSDPTAAAVPSRSPVSAEGREPGSTIDPRHPSTSRGVSGAPVFSKAAPAPKQAVSAVVRPAGATADSGAQGVDAAAASEPRSIERDDVDRLISRFIDAYQSGDIDRFIGLFAEYARTNDGVGPKVIRDGYGGLFEASRTRTLEVENLRWEGRGRVGAKLHFSVRIRISRGLLFSTDDYAGDVDMFVVREDEAVRIAEFIHRVAEL